MGIPGMNLYAMATSLIGKQDYKFFSFIDNTTDDRGIDVPAFDPAVDLRDSIQAIPRSLFQSLGLDYQRSYIMIYTDNPLITVERNRPGDQISIGTDRFQLLSTNDWTSIDGWQGVLAVRQDPETSV